MMINRNLGDIQMKLQTLAAGLLFSAILANYGFAGDIDMNLAPEGAEEISVKGDFVSSMVDPSIDKSARSNPSSVDSEQSELVFIADSNGIDEEAYLAVRGHLKESESGTIDGRIHSTSKDVSFKISCYLAEGFSTDFILCQTADTFILWKNPASTGQLFFGTVR